MEKIKPIESKLKYQIDKLIIDSFNQDFKNETDNQNLLQDHLKFKPNPSNFIQNNQVINKNNDDIDTDDQKYKPPNISEVHFKETKNRSTKLNEKTREKILKSRMLKELEYQYDTKPEQEGFLFNKRNNRNWICFQFYWF